MTVISLAPHYVEKPWGRTELPAAFADATANGARIGEIWFQHPDDAAGGAADPLLIKYLFTSEKLSVQVHPDDAQAKAAGLPSGKDEAWVILAADPEATIALGTHRALSGEELRAAALDGSIEKLVDWVPVKAGEVIYSPARTVHAIGAGLALVEVQQNVDVTYRLYDYGRPRPLHLDEGVAVADARPFTRQPAARDLGDGRHVLVEGPKFVIERWSGGKRDLVLADDTPAWLVPLAGTGIADATPFKAGDCLMLRGIVTIEASTDADLLIAYPGHHAR